MESDASSVEVDENFIRAGFDFIRQSQKRSLLWTITSWMELSAKPNACLLVDTESLFPRFSHLDPKVAKFLPEIYACIDQLLVVLTQAAADLHKAAEGQEDDVERNRTAAVAEIIKCIATHVYAIRVLSLTGFDVQVRQIVRTYIEYLELLALVCADSAALDEFIASGDSEGANSFWHQHISKSKARKKRYFSSVLKTGLPEEEQERNRRWHDGQLRLLSECAHPTLGSVLRSGQISYDPFITPDDKEDVIGSLIYTFCAFADTLEIPTYDYLRSKLKADEPDGEAEICKRLYLLFMLSVILGYRKDFVFWGDSNIESDLAAALKDEERRRSEAAPK